MAVVCHVIEGEVEVEVVEEEEAVECENTTEQDLAVEEAVIKEQEPTTGRKKKVRKKGRDGEGERERAERF